LTVDNGKNLWRVQRVEKWVKVKEKEREKETDHINIQSLKGRKSFQNLITTQHANEWHFGAETALWWRGNWWREKWSKLGLIGMGFDGGLGVE
jgi:hypothetical protein